RTSRTGKALDHPVPGLGRDRLAAVGGGAPQRFEVAEPLALGEELGVLFLTRRRGLDLLDLERQQVELPVSCTGELAKLLCASLEPCHALVQRAELVTHGHVLDAAVSVE